MGLVFEWISEQGGVAEMEERSAKKSQLIYNMINLSNGFYTCPAAESARSRVNIPFRIQGGNETLEKQFLDEAKLNGMIQLKGHRSVGGIRVSLYNAISIQETALLADFMNEFMLKAHN